MIKQAEYGSSSRFKTREILIHRINALSSAGLTLLHEAERAQRDLVRIFGFRPLTQDKLQSLVLDIYTNRLYVALKCYERHQVQERCFEITRVTALPFGTMFLTHIQGTILPEGYDEIRDCLRGLSWEISCPVVSHVNKKYSTEELISGEILYSLQDYWISNPKEINRVLYFLNKKKT